ncbi:tRNA pseudouridine(65) synthase TruC [Neptunicella sp.]|uniref:tRNA pseudouridine(65) synthase TruC n=1 Tax=Neptunicella sp. TaxID=2125986 RepID=UPI003F691E1D
MLEILYQDEYVVAINKPPGLLVHRSMLDKYATEFAMQLLRDQIGQHVYPVHRLDRPTSGVLLFGLSPEIATLLNVEFAEQRVNKTYVAVVRGYAQEEGILDYPLKEELDKIADKKANKDKQAQSAVTEYQRLATIELDFPVGRYNSARFSLMKLSPKTGRKHQLRRHMAHLRHPIIGDTSHGDGKQNRFVKEQFNFAGLALCCTSLSLLHPISQQVMSIEATLSDNMQQLVAAWGWQQYL